MQNLDIYRENIKEINGIETLIMKINNKDINLLKSIAETILSDMKNGFILFINIKPDDSVNFIAKSNSKINAGMIVKDASMTSNGNGGGSPTFAQGGGKTSDKIDEIIEKVEKVIKSND